jgi:peptidoglycan glycosyltransferase
MTASIRRMSLVLTVMLLVLALVTGYWQVLQGAALTARDDNPRLVLAERQIPRGELLDRNGEVLAFSQSTPGGDPARQTYVRTYADRAAEPVVGYYSLRYGVGGAEAAFDDELRGIAGQTRLDAVVNKWLHRTPPGQSVRLTLDLAVQRAADAALGDRPGAVVVLSVPEGEVIALVSHPNFEPNTLDEDWERLRADAASPLLNRATQGLYQPGSAFQTVVLAEALSAGLVHMTDTVSSISSSVAFDGAALCCATAPAGKTLDAAFAAACPAPFAALADQMTAQQVAQIVRRWSLDVAPDPFELPTHATVFSSDSLTTPVSVRNLILGQGALTMSPLQMATTVTIIANDGRPVVAPHLAAAPAPTTSASAVIPSQIARAIRSALPVHGDLAGQAALALSGENQIAWFAGFAPAPSPRWVIVTLVENGDATTVSSIAAQIRPELGP